MFKDTKDHIKLVLRLLDNSEITQNDAYNIIYRIMTTNKIFNSFSFMVGLSVGMIISTVYIAIKFS